MDGQIGLQSAPGKGSAFWFEIPFDIETEIFEGEPISDTRDEIEHIEGRVLLAEDNPTNQMIAQLMLTKLGLTVDVVADGLEAVESLRIRNYDLVLMDIAMPEMDGITATRKIREIQGRHLHTPIIALTAHAMQGDRESILAEGLDDYLVKPINQSTLQSCLARWLKK